MVRNSVDFPMDFRRFIEGGEASTLFIDAFDLWGFRGDFTLYSHNLGLKNEEGTFLIAQDAHVTRIHFGFGTTLSF
jgi:hypothetical protein